MCIIYIGFHIRIYNWISYDIYANLLIFLDCNKTIYGQQPVKFCYMVLDFLEILRESIKYFFDIQPIKSLWL